MKTIISALMSLLIVLSSIGATTSHAEAGAVKKAYVAYRVTKAAIHIVRYVKLIHRVSGKALDSRQAELLKDCFRNPSCVTWLKNPSKWTSGKKDGLIKVWEKMTSQTWPKHANGTPYEAHHIIPKQYGGPHEWWNMHPVPRPDHQSIVHAANGALRKIVQIYGGP